MKTIDIAKARVSLSSLVAELERGELKEVVITRYAPVARLLSARETQRMGVTKGAFVVPDDFNAQDDEITTKFNGQ